MSPKTELTRVRLEAHGPDQQQVSIFLTTTAAEIRTEQGGEWILEDDKVETMPTQSGGVWGRLTIRRSDA